MRGYSLVLETPLALAITLGMTQRQMLANITNEAADWTRSVRLQGGYWLGSFSLPLTTETWLGFDRWLGAHVTERSGGVVSWEGLVYEMELSHGGVVRRRSLDSMTNQVRADWSDLAGNPQETAWVTNTDSIGTFGRKDYILEGQGRIDTEVEAQRDSQLQYFGWPWPDAVSVCPPMDSRLTVQCCGYAYTLNWRYISAAAKTEPHTGGDLWDKLALPTPDHLEETGVDLSAWATAVADEPARYTVWCVEDIGNIVWGYLGPLDPGRFSAPGANDSVWIYTDQELTTTGMNGTWHWVGSWDTPVIRGGPHLFISDILANDSEFVSEGVLGQSYASIDRDIESPERGWDAVMRGVSLGDQDQHPWRAWVTKDRRLHYDAISTTPQFQHRAGRWFDAGGKRVNPWLIAPGVIRDLTWRHRIDRTDFWLSDPRDFVVSEFEVDADGTITPQLGLNNEALANQLAQEMGWSYTAPVYEQTGPAGGFWANMGGGWYWQGIGQPIGQPGTGPTQWGWYGNPNPREGGGRF